MHRAKEYLQEYQRARRKVEFLSEQIEELESKYKLPPAIQYSDMPKAHNSNRDLSDYIVKYERLVKKRETAMKKCMGRMDDITNRLNRMSNDDEKEVLWKRYVKDMSWTEVIESMPYTDRHIYRLHGTALNNFPLPKRCQ